MTLRRLGALVLTFITAGLFMGVLSWFATLLVFFITSILCGATFSKSLTHICAWVMAVAMGALFGAFMVGEARKELEEKR